MAGRDDNPGRGDPHHKQFDDLKIKLIDLLIDFALELVERIGDDEEEPAFSVEKREE